MALFTQRRPRRFRYESRFGRESVSHGDNNKDNESLSESTYNETSRVKLQKGVFINATHYLSRRKEKRRTGGLYMSTALCVLLIILLVVAWHLLMTK
ncbi:MAG: hypothetical protein ACI4V5_08225 [Prevotella sp.]